MPPPVDGSETSNLAIGSSNLSGGAKLQRGLAQEGRVDNSALAVRVRGPVFNCVEARLQLFYLSVAQSGQSPGLGCRLSQVRILPGRPNFQTAEVDSRYLIATRENREFEALLK